MKSFIEFINEGAWGYLPMNSDSALDFRGNILKSIFKQINDEFEKSFNETRYVSLRRYTMVLHR